MEKVCLECGDKLVGRSDKKFCSDYCRNAHNNTINTDSKNLIRNIGGLKVLFPCRIFSYWTYLFTYKLHK